MTVSALRQLSPDRVLVTLEDGEEIRSSLGVVTDPRLYTGCALDDKALDAFRRDSLRALARDRALTLVSQRQYSAKELREKLLGKGVDADSADYCVQWLAEHGFLDEAHYAAAIVRHYAAKGYGPGRIRMELQRRGIPRELQDEALADAPEDTEKLDRFLARKLIDPTDRDAVRKVTAALYRRGFSGEEIRSALLRLGSEEL